MAAATLHRSSDPKSQPRGPSRDARRCRRTCAWWCSPIAVTKDGKAGVQSGELVRVTKSGFEIAASHAARAVQGRADDLIAKRARIGGGGSIAPSLTRPLKLRESDAQGNYSFPAAKLEPGQYSLRIRAVGYDLDRPASVDVAAQQPAKYDLKLRRTRDLAASSRTASGWRACPARTSRRRGCCPMRRLPHARARGALARRGRHLHKDLLPRMQGYVNQSIPSHRARQAPSGGWRSAATSACRSIARTPSFSRPSTWARARSGAIR